jgi:acyl carrier protein
MEEAAIYDKLTTVFHEVFDEPDLVLRPDLIAEDVDGWDSLTHVRLVLAVSKAFAVRFSAAEIGGLENVGDFVALIRTKA